MCELPLPFTGRPLGTWTQEWVREANAVARVVLSCAESQGVWKHARPSEALKREAGVRDPGARRVDDKEGARITVTGRPAWGRSCALRWAEALGSQSKRSFPNGSQGLRLQGTPKSPLGCLEV